MDELIQKLMERIEQLEAEVAELRRENVELRRENAELRRENAELRARLNKNSGNSSKPPSSDGYRKPAPKNSRVANGRKSGGQPGHEGRTRTANPNPDEILHIKPKTHCECGGKINDTDRFTRRQVDEIEIHVRTVEYRAYDGVCAECGKLHKAGFPAGVDSPVVLGDRANALMTYLNQYQLIPLARTKELFKDLFNMNVAESSILRAIKEAYHRLEESEKAVKQELIDSEVCNFDETGMRVKCATYWLFVAGNESATVYEVHKGRGHEAMDAMGILPFFKGTAIHDHWKSYYKYGCAHGECNAHILRALLYLDEELDISWARDMFDHLMKIKRHVDLSRAFGAERLEQEDIDRYTARYREIWGSAPVDKNAQTDARRLATRFRKYEDETLLFMLDFNVPFTNNQAERDLRMPKAKTKISGAFRTEDGAEHFARIRGFISTAKKKGKGALDGLKAVFAGSAKEFLYPQP